MLSSRKQFGVSLAGLVLMRKIALDDNTNNSTFARSFGLDTGGDGPSYMVNEAMVNDDVSLRPLLYIVEEIIGDNEFSYPDRPASRRDGADR